MENKIDFVLAWVDGADPEWQADKEKYTGIKADVDVCRYRDWDLLRYWFRGVEKYAPWVNKIHFVTWGHLPTWLNTKHPKLSIVNHKDFIPEDYLPTFNANTIELNFHRIKDLEEQFVYFNDDIFVISRVSPEDFFYDGKPCDTVALDTLRFDKNSVGYLNANNMTVLNDHYDKKAFVKSNWLQLINPVLGRNKVIKNLFFMKYPYFTGFYDHHLCTSFLKSSYEFAWEKHIDVLDNTCKSKIRARHNVNQWLIKDIQIVRGIFKNRGLDFGARINIRKNNYKRCMRWIRKQKLKVLCVNDNESVVEFEEISSEIRAAFEEILGERSKFEL